MASMLRSARYLFNVVSFIRLKPFKYSHNIGERLLVENLGRNISTGYLTRYVTSPLSMEELKQQDTLLDKGLRKIDQDVRRTGRIAKKDLEDVLAGLDTTKSISSTQALLIIRCCGKLLPEERPCDRTEIVVDLWKRLEALGTQFDISHFNALLRVFIENGHGFVPNEILNLLKKKDIKPNRVTYCRLMTRYCQLGDMDGATSILQLMRDQQMPINEGVFNTLLMGHIQAGDMPSALSVMDLMRQASIEPSEETYVTLICGYAKSGDIEAMKQLVEESKAKQLFLQHKDYMDIIFTLSVGGWAKRVDEIIELLEQRKSLGYNQDALNLVLRLVAIDQVDVAFKVLKTMPRGLLPNGKLAPTGNIFIRQMVKTKQPVEKIIEVCQEMIRYGLNVRALHVALEHSLQLGTKYSQMSEELMTALQTIDPSMKQHQFWPLLVSRGKDGDIPGMLKVIEHMRKDFNLAPSSTSLRDHVIPYLPQENSSEYIIDTLKSAQISTASAACALVAYRLAQCNIAEAARIAANHNAHYSPALLRRSLSTAYLRSKDLASYLTIITRIVESVSQANNTSVSTEVNPDEVVGSYIVDLLNLEDSNNKVPTILAVLQGLADEGLGMDKESGEQIKLRLGTELTDDVSNLIDKLTSGDLKPRTRRPFMSRGTDLKDIPYLEKLKATLEEQSESTLAVRKQLLSLYCRNRDLDKTEAVKATLDEEQFVYTSGSLAQLIDLYTHHELLDKAWSVYEQLMEREPEFPLGHTKVVKLATLLVKGDRFEDCMQVLNEQGKNREPLNEPSFSYTNLCWRLLNTLAESGKVSELTEVFNALTTNKYITVSNVLLGPLVKVHIVRDDIPAALEEFERSCQLYRATPFKNDLACKLIMSKNSAALQKLTDLSTGIHGEVNSLFDLVFSFVECGKIKHARRILETPGLGSRPQRLQSACERYSQDGNIGPLLGLLHATKDSAHIVDRSIIYTNLLVCYAKANDVDKAIELWTSMQDEDVVANDQFLRQLAMLLQKNGCDVPFDAPNQLPPKPVSLPVVEEVKKVVPAHIPPTPVARLRKALRIDSKRAAGEKSFYMDELKKMAVALISDLDKKITPELHDLKFALRQLAAAGELDNIETIGNILPEELKKLLNFERYICIANAVTGKGEEYLAKLERQITEAKSEDLESLKAHYPRVGSTTLLIHNPELIQRFEDMARSYAVRHIYFPINDLWAYLFEIGEESQAGELWSEFLKDSPRIVVEHVLETARLTGDIVLAQRLCSQLKCSDKVLWIVGAAHSCLIDIYVNKRESDNALKVLNDAVEAACFAGIKRTTIKRLKQLLQSERRVLPENIRNLMQTRPAVMKNNSSSDEEK